MAITLDKIDFDPTDATEHSRIGSFIVSSSGDVIDSTDVSGTEGLNVNVLNDITAQCELDGIYVVSTNDDPDNVGIIAHTRAASLTDTEQVERTTAASPSSDDLAPANIVGLDTNSFLHGFDGTNWDRLSLSANGLEVDITNSVDLNVNLQAGDGTDITQTGGSLDVNITNSSLTVDISGSLVNDDDADAGGSLKTGSRALTTASAIGAVSAADDRADMVSDLYRRLMVRDSMDVAWQTSASTATTTAGELAATPLGGRKKVIIQNLGSQDAYVGSSAAVTTANGILVPKNGSMEFEFGEALNIFAITGSSTADLRVLEAA